MAEKAEAEAAPQAEAEAAPQAQQPSSGTGTGTGGVGTGTVTGGVSSSERAVSAFVGYSCGAVVEHACAFQSAWLGP